MAEAPQRDDDPAPVVVFDFDHTLTSHDTAAHFFRWLLRRSPWRSGMLLAALPFLAPLLLLRKTRGKPLRFAVWVATLGHDEDSLHQEVQVHVQELFASGGAVVRRDGVARLNWHRRQGHAVVVATGALEGLARAILDRHGFSDVPLVATRLKPHLFGMAAERRCIGRNKPLMLAERGFHPPFAAVYTDHELDMPLLERTQRRYLVNPTPGTLRFAEKVLRPRAEILEWK